MNKRKIPNIVLGFGKYQGLSVAQVATGDPQYLTWLASRPFVRANKLLWASVRGHLLAILHREIEAEIISELG